MEVRVVAAFLESVDHVEAAIGVIDENQCVGADCCLVGFRGMCLHGFGEYLCGVWVGEFAEAFEGLSMLFWVGTLDGLDETVKASLVAHPGKGSVGLDVLDRCECVSGFGD